MTLKTCLLQFTLLLLVSYAKSQDAIPLTIVDGLVTFESVAIADSLSAAEIHERTLNWLGSTFKRDKDVITLNTPSRIISRYSMNYGYSKEDFIHQIIIDIKDAKAKFLINNIEGIQEWIKDNGTEWKPFYTNMKIEAETKINALYQSYLKELNTNSSDW
jgi:hypothetical protein